MTDPRQFERLLGGYAAGTLTEEERQALFQASLEHQELFEALMREQPLRDVMQDPAARGALLAALQDLPPAWQRRWKWPLVLAPTLVGIAVGCIYVVIIRIAPPPPPPPAVVEIKPPAPPADALIPLPHGRGPETRDPLIATQLTFPPPAAVPGHYSLQSLRRAGAAPNLGVDYSLVHSGSAIALRFVPNDNGYLYIFDGARVVAASAVQRFQPYTTPPLDPGAASLTVLFARQSQALPRAALDRIGLNFEASSGDGTAVARDASQPLIFVINLR